MWLLVDSSIWIFVYRKHFDPKFKQRLQELALQGRIAVNPIIYLELLQVATSEGNFEILKTDLQVFHQLPLTNSVIEQAAKMGFQLRKRGHSIAIPDLVIAACAIEFDCELWHQDTDFSIIARYYPLKEIKPPQQPR